VSESLIFGNCKANRQQGRRNNAEQPENSNKLHVENNFCRDPCGNELVKGSDTTQAAGETR